MRTGQDKKWDWTIFVPPLHGDFFNQDGITRQDEIISAPHFRA